MDGGALQVPGASEGAGLGNKFLNDLCGADVLVHIIDVSGTTNEKGEVSGCVGRGRAPGLEPSWPPSRHKLYLCFCLTRMRSLCVCVGMWVSLSLPPLFGLPGSVSRPQQVTTP